MTPGVEYANRLSRWLLRDSFERQFVAPVDPPWLLALAVRWLERGVLRPDTRGIRIDRPIFIVGLPRSGTSLLLDLLACHAHAAYFTHAMHQYRQSVYGIEWVRRRLKLNVRGERYLRDSLFVEAGSASEPAMFWTEWVGRDPHALHWPELELRDLPVETVDAMRRTIKLVIAACGAPRRRLVCKYPAFTTEVALLQELFPDARFVHIVRDGRLVANSMIKLYRICRDQLARIRHPAIRELVPYPRVPRLAEYVARYGPEDLRCTARVWRDGLQLLARAKPGLTAFYELRHEDLLEDPEGQIEKLLSFCELPSRREDTAALRAKLAEVGVLSHRNTYGDFDVVEEIAGAELARYGYCRPSSA